MEFARLVRNRRMTRRYQDLPSLDKTLLAQWFELATRAPSAGFSQGWDFVVLTGSQDRERYWSLTSTPGTERDAWLTGMMSAPILVLCLSDQQRYLDRYAEPDKGWTDRDPARWPVPYWDLDTAMAALLLQLAAVDHGWGACFFGVPPAHHDAVREGFEIPANRNLIGAIGMGPAAVGPRSPSLRRGRRPVSEVVHDGRFAVPWPVSRVHPQAPAP